MFHSVTKIGMIFPEVLSRWKCYIRLQMTMKMEFSHDFSRSWKICCQIRPRIVTVKGRYLVWARPCSERCAPFGQICFQRDGLEGLVFFFFPMGFPLGFPMRVRVNSDGLCAWFDSNSFFPMFFFPIVFFQWFSSGLCFPEVQGRLEHGEPVDVYRTGYSRRVFWYPDFEACLNEMLGPWCCEVWTRKLRMSTSTSCGIGMETF